MGALLRVETLVRFVGRLDVRLVGTAALYSSRGGACVYVVSTLKEFWGQGIGTQLTAAALNAGRAPGLRGGTLQASSMGMSAWAAPFELRRGTALAMSEQAVHTAGHLSVLVAQLNGVLDATVRPIAVATEAVATPAHGWSPSRRGAFKPGASRPLPSCA
ncbi:GNAT family N-acetyltransferase [Streptomyces sp. SCL15-6]|uniref:GNAT family N-acetyltransferase n=1 Tax=Streptomyces sp. SCL15-6 TaxID=2967222 RepID=UPI00398FB209